MSSPANKLRLVAGVVPLVLAVYLLGTYVLRLDVAAQRTHRSACALLPLEPVKPPLAPAQIRLSTLDGQPFSLAQLRGRLVVVNFWLTTCQPCLRELPSLVELGRRYRGHGLTLLLVSTDKKLADIQAFVAKVPRLREMTSNVVLLHDPGAALANRLGTEKFPETYLVSPSGRWLGRVVGDRDWTGRAATSCLYSRLP